MPKTRTLVFKQSVHAPLAEVYRAFTNPTALRDWFCSDARVDLRTHQLYLWWKSGFFVTGEFVTLEPNHRIVFTWRGKTDPASSRVNVKFVEKDGMTHITVKHSGIGAGKLWSKTANEIERGWLVALENLQSVWEAGVDLRQARVPRLGIFIGELNQAIADKLGVPTLQGIRLEGTAEGTGAHAAGLQKDDVVIKLGGKKIGGVPALFRALQDHHAGDKVQVVFYRGKELRKGQMELSARPIPPLPASGQELAEQARATYRQLNAELTQRLDGLTDQQADFRIAPDAWSIKEMIAHLIVCERDFQSWLSELLNGGKATNGQVDDSLEFRTNANLRLVVFIARYPTLPVLLDEMKTSQEETLAMLRALPAEFIARKHLYRRAADWMTQVVPTHFRDEHYPDLDRAIELARR